jgi:predicted PurR-regulated permease PerM
MNERYVPGPDAIGRRPASAAPSPPGRVGDHDGSYIEKALAILVLLVLLAGCLVVLRPFIAAILWATILAYATWPAYAYLLRFLNGRRGLAAGLLTLAIGGLLLFPVILLGMSLAENVVRLIEVIRRTMVAGLPPPPWLIDLPFVGQKLAAFWDSVTHDAVARTAALQPYVGPLRDWLLARGGDVVEGILQLTLSLLTAFFFYRDGPTIVATLEAIGTKLAGPRAGTLLRTAGGTINGVVRGVLGTALIQAILMAIAFWATGVPAPLLLGCISFFLSIIPMALIVVWLPATIWLAAQDATVAAAAIAIWGIVVGQIDSFLRPYFISRGSELPVLLILLGILGGAVAFGFVGIFLGPTLLAIAHSLIRDWGRPAAEPAATPEHAWEAPPRPGVPVSPSPTEALR